MEKQIEEEQVDYAKNRAIIENKMDQPQKKNTVQFKEYSINEIINDANQRRLRSRLFYTKFI